MAAETGVVVLGGANVDVKAWSGEPLVAATSNPGTTVVAPGGVGRNIAENLARLGTPVHLVAAVGNDPFGDQLLAATAAAGVDVGHVRRSSVHPTGTYTAVLDADGELAVAIADMAATEALGPDDVRAAGDLIAAAALVVVDGNLAPATAGCALDLAAAAGVRVVVEPVSVPKAARLAGQLRPGRPVFAATPNAAELAALTGRATGTGRGTVTDTTGAGARTVRRDSGSDGAGPGSASCVPDDQLHDAVRALHDVGVELVWVRLGDRGSLLSGPSGETRLPAPAPLAEVRDVTGAGDAMLAAFCHALLDGDGDGATPAEAAAYGHAAAALTVASPHTVRPDLADQLAGNLRR